MGFFANIWADIEEGWKKLFGSAGATVTAAVEADIKVIGSALTGALSDFENITGLDAALVATIQSTVASIEAAALQVVTGIATNLAEPLVTQIVNDFQVFEGAIAGAAVTVPTALENIIKAVTTLLPYIEAGVGILTAANSKASATVAASEATGLTADEARSILGGVAAKAP
jgi:hypothetical protein